MCIRDRYKIETGETDPASTPTYSQIYGEKLTEFAKKDDSISVITAAMPGGTGLATFRDSKEVSDRYFDVGIAEEHAALFSCGLAIQNFKPFLTI